VEKESEWERQKIEYPKIEWLIIYISYSPLRRPKMTISKPKRIQGCPIFHFGRWSPAIAIWCPQGSGGCGVAAGALQRVEGQRLCTLDEHAGVSENWKNTPF
jgi:hypothetical protein